MDLAQADKAPWRAQGEEKRETVRQMFAEIAPSYDRVNSIMSFSRHRAWREQAVALLNLKMGDRALDICCGTGDFLVPLRKAVAFESTPSPGSLRSPASPSRGEAGVLVEPSGLVVGADYCAPMLQRAAEKLNTKRLSLADACALPFASETFDAVTVGWGLRNLADMGKGLREVVRVLKPGGRFVSVDMAIPDNPLIRGVSKLVSQFGLPTLGRLFGSKDAYTYLPKSAETFATRQQLKESFEAAGLIDVRWKNRLFGNICIVWGRKP
ncbi:MAG: class I SAM-dependent methyltransferase [Armatimonadetes bacterium]|nr:class I SAM-dependent methyltransferase [Armatimonadota bacterium]